MFNLTKPMLMVLLVLSKSEAWPVFIKEFRQIRDDNLDIVIHHNPASDDVNARQRQDLFRGVAVCLDVLYHAFENPIELLEDIKLAEKTTESQQLANS